MQIIPAVDIRGGKCVRLFQGRYDRETVFADDPATQAKAWADQGAALIHVVDLDGAREGRPVNLQAISRIVSAVEADIEVGGGVRTDETIAQLLEAGVARVVIGTRALRDPDWAGAAAQAHPGRVALGLDARGGRIAVQGWTEMSDVPVAELAARLDPAGFGAIIYTDIGRDGAMEGPDIEGTLALANAVTTPVIASGGITRMADVRRLARLPIAGMIIGRALYEGTIDLGRAIRAAAERE